MLSPHHCQHRLLWRNAQAASKECCPGSPWEQTLPPLLFIQTHSSCCLANYLGQWVRSASRVLCPHRERGILCGDRILLRLHMRRAPLQACIFIPFLCKGPAGGEWKEGKPQKQPWTTLPIPHSKATSVKA